MSFVDVARRPPAPAELQRFSRRFGAAALLDRDGALYRETGLAYITLDDSQVLERLMADPRLLRLPLVRSGARVSIGLDEAAWRGWLAEE